MGKPGIGAVILEELTQNAQNILEGEAVVRQISKQDAAVTRTWTNAAFAAGAGNISQLKTIRDIGALIQSLDATQDNKNLIIDLAYVRYEVSCSGAFHFVPILALCENGETVATQSGNISDPKVDLDLGITGIFSNKFGTPMVSRRIRDNGANYWLTRGTFNITAECRKYTKQMIRDNLNEQSLKELFSIGHSVSEAEDQSVSVMELTVIQYHLEDTKIVNI